MRIIQCNSKKGTLIIQEQQIKTAGTLNRRFVNKSVDNELFWVDLADKSKAMLL